MCQPVTLAPPLVVVADALTLKVRGTVALLAGLVTVTVTPAARALEARSRQAARPSPNVARMDLVRDCMLHILSKFLAIGDAVTARLVLILRLSRRTSTSRRRRGRSTGGHFAYSMPCKYQRCSNGVVR